MIGPFGAIGTEVLYVQVCISIPAAYYALKSYFI
jgi:hypothetical protein